MASTALKRTKARKSTKRRGFEVKGHREIEEKRQEIRDRMDPGQRLHGARGYHGIARELQLLVSNDQDNSLTKIASEAGVTMQTLKKIWAGRTKRPSFQTVELIMRHYNLDLGTARRLTVVKD